MKKEDKVFTKPIEKQFEFDDEVAAVFDDMLQRSVPFYKESQDMTLYFAKKALESGGIIYDLGSSTATMLLNLERQLERDDVKFIGLDTSEAMLNHARKKIDIFNSKVEVIHADILEYDYKSAKVMVSNYTLQFIRPLVREKLIQKIYRHLDDDGIFIFSEKIISEDAKLNKELIDCYYNFKQSQGYSMYEIMQKREALENVLIPYTEQENREMLKNAGFSHCEIIFRWANFATFIAKK